MLLVDTNIVLRYLLQDHPALSPKAKEILANNDVLLLTQVIAETIYVLDGCYNFTRQRITDTLLKLSSLDNIYFENNEIVVLALDKYSQTKLDFVDTLLYAHNQVTGLPVETFDKDLLRSLKS
ncbi:MAG: PIN domain-containing protein [Candidatus Margulisbacteria bacterium]|jgi:predicted nucleic-acid-binding protein|nr:PIN domain-containing protein [Candidatus Margulisiibacteriota bacterium]